MLSRFILISLTLETCGLKGPNEHLHSGLKGLASGKHRSAPCSAVFRSGEVERRATEPHYKVFLFPSRQLRTSPGPKTNNSYNQYLERNSLIRSLTF